MPNHVFKALSWEICCLFTCWLYYMTLVESLNTFPENVVKNFSKLDKTNMNTKFIDKLDL